MKEVSLNFLLIVITVLIKYRLPLRLLKLRWTKSVTFIVMLMVHFFAGKANLYFHLANDIGGNTLYYGIITMGLYATLFQGNMIKKMFLTTLISCGFPITFYICLPFAHYFFGQEVDVFTIVLRVLEVMNLLLCAVGLEYVGKKFRNLRRELPAGYTIYLTAVIIFVYVAIFSAYDRLLIMNKGKIPLMTALVLSGFAVFGMFIVMVAIFAVDRQVNVCLREQLMAMQVENVKSRKLEWKKLASFRHDMKNHLICMNQLLEQKKVTQAADYMKHLMDTVKQLESPVQTGNDYADALLSVKYAEAAEAKIKVAMGMAIPDEGFVDPVDLCCILSNAFDNAIAACCLITEEERWIEARAFIKQGQFVIEIKNSKPSDVTVIDGEVFPKEVTADHGLGLDAVKAVVEKYGGILRLSADTAFSFSVLLPKRI